MSSNKKKLDFQKALNAVTRTVSEQYCKEGVPVRDIRLERVYTTSSDDLWEAITNPKRLERFFSPARSLRRG